MPQACAFLELVSSAGGPERFGVGMDTNIVTASAKALLSGVNRLGLQWRRVKRLEQID
jgi:2-isopropylmalate synthase